MSNSLSSDIARLVDEKGDVRFSSEDAAELLLRGYDITKLLFDESATLRDYNKWCVLNNKTAHKLSSVAASPPLSERASTWWISDEFRSIDVRRLVLERCKTDAERRRAEEEMDLYEERDLLPVLRLMLFLVDHFRRNNIVWGVGRGSSVASFVLYLIGVHKIHPIRHGLDIHDFLRDD